MPTVHLIIKGKVQGVFYRATAKDMAEQIGIKGWVKNTIAGDVEVMATGTEEQLNQFIEWCRGGPSKARVTEVLIDRRNEEIFERFRIER